MHFTKINIKNLILSGGIMLKRILLILTFLITVTAAQEKSNYDLEKNSLSKTSHDHLVYDYLTVTNGMLEGTLLKDGYFTLGTELGTSRSPLDDNCQITYGHPFAKTSYPVVIIDGEEKLYTDLFTDLTKITSFSSSRTLAAYNENEDLIVMFTVTIKSSFS